ncbi:MAG TPA: quinone-dependent dihydroorotate dehydrogenase [Tepidisphaeraceae bacterium]|jgi:dihydroorotate dehydrogenase
MGLYDWVRPILFSLPPEAAHHLGIGGLRSFGKPPMRGMLARRLRVDDPALRVTLGDGAVALHFPNPVGLAAGFDKNARALRGLEALGFGFLEAGTITPLAQPGNPKPRIFRVPEAQALVNRLGFNNDGIAGVLKTLERTPRLSIPLGFNVGKNKVTPLERAADDYVKCVEAFFPRADFFVVNVSSPNTPGLRNLQAPEELEPLLRAVSERADALAAQHGRARPPLFVKVSPDEEFGEAVVEVAVRQRFAGIVATNTTRSREGMPPSAPTDGGASGAPLRARSTEHVRRLYRAAAGRLTIIGVGGIFSAEDAYEKILAGATLVEIYTGFIYKGFTLPRDINRGLLELLRRDGFRSVSEAVGTKA